MPMSYQPTRSGDDSGLAGVLAFALGVTAGATDIVGFLELGGLFTAHITGNIVVLAAKLVAGEQAPLADVIAVPAFVVVLALARLFVAGLERLQVASLPPLLLLQFLMLAGFFIVGFGGGQSLDPSTALAIVAGMLGVSAMAVQNVLVRTSLRGAPATAVMTTNITVFTIDVGEILLGRDSSGIARARDRAGRTWPAIIGFLLGCALGAACKAAFGPWALALPPGVALLALTLGVFVSVRRHETMIQSERST